MMSKLSYFDVSGWLEDGTPLPAENKQEVIDILEELIADDFKQNLDAESVQFMRFSTEYEYAPEEVQEACSKYAESHPSIILELEYTDHDEGFISVYVSRISCASAMMQPIISCRSKASPFRRKSHRCR